MYTAEKFTHQNSLKLLYQHFGTVYKLEFFFQKAHHASEGDNEAVNLASATPVLNQKLRPNIRDKPKPKIQSQAGKKTNRKSSHTSRVQNNFIYTKSNKSDGSSSHFTQARLLGNGNSMSINRTTKKKSLSVSPEARSLIPHSQRRVSLNITQLMAQNDPQDNQVSDTSNESTETAIYLNNISPPNTTAQQMNENARVVLSSQSNAQQYTNKATQHTWQQEPLQSATDENGPQAHQAGIMAELENVIMQQREQTQSQMHVPEGKSKGELGVKKEKGRERGEPL